MANGLKPRLGKIGLGPISIVPFPPAELLLDLRVELAEGPIWNPLTRRLNFVDILGQRVYEYDPVSRRQRSFATPSPVGTVVPRSRGGLVIALADGIATLDTESGAVRPLVTPREHDPAVCRFNDGKCDPQGRLWAGTFGRPIRPGRGSLYCFPPDGPPRRVLDGVGVSNGLAWSLDGRRLYYIDSAEGRVDGFNFDPATGALSDRRPVIHLPEGEGLPDGSTIDAEGKLWVAQWGGYKVSRWDPESGQSLGHVSVPVPLASACAFGGEDLGTLFITTARENMTAAELAKAPTSGGIYACRPGVRGIAAYPFAG